jgi:hypothetical protein
MSRLSAVVFPDVRDAIVNGMIWGELAGTGLGGDARWLIVRATCIVERALGGRQSPPTRMAGTANPDRNKSLIHLRFWKVQSTTVQGFPAIPGQLTVPYSSSTCCATTNKKTNFINHHKVFHRSADRLHIIR